MKIVAETMLCTSKTLLNLSLELNSKNYEIICTTNENKSLQRKKHNSVSRVSRVEFQRKHNRSPNVGLEGLESSQKEEIKIAER